jgi:hypothetical protein
MSHGEYRKRVMRSSSGLDSSLQQFIAKRGESLQEQVARVTRHIFQAISLSECCGQLHYFHQVYFHRG